MSTESHEDTAEDVIELPAEIPANLDESACNPRRKTARSRVTNHADLLPDLDGRSSAARRFRDLIRSYIVDMGGLGQCSEIRLGLLRRLAATTVQAELLEAQMINGQPVSITELCALASTTVRLSSRLGLERVAKTVGPSSFGDMLRADIAKRRRRAERLEATTLPP